MTSSTLLEVSGTDDVTIEQLRFEALTAAPCTEVERIVAITNDARRAVVRSSQIVARGTATTGPCGYKAGIVVEASPSARIANSLIRDFRYLGIRFSALSSGWVVDNNLKSLDLDAPADVQGPPQHGIVVDASSAIVAGNRVASGVDAGDAGTPQLVTAIVFANSSGSVVRDNWVRRSLFGIGLASAANAVVRNNDLKSGVYGITASAASDHRIVGNHVRGYDEGIHVASTTAGNVLRDNDFTGNVTWNCVDDSTGTGTSGTANTWTSNLGDTDDPDGIYTGALVDRGHRAAAYLATRREA